MKTDIPSTDELRLRLKAMTLHQMSALAAASGVPYPTLYKIRYKQTLNPGIETVRQFLPHLPKEPTN